jgi:hypothetical protein
MPNNDALTRRVFIGSELIAAFRTQDEAVMYAKDVKERMYSPTAIPPVYVFHNNRLVVTL